MEINRVRYFRTVFEVGSIRRASEILNITPGALSKSLKILEEELGEPLFTPLGRNITPSDFGKKFYQLSEKLIGAHTTLQSELEELSLENRFTIASWEVFSSYFCSHLAQSINFDVQLKVIERVPNQLEQAILDGQADVGITYAPIPHPDLEFIKLGQIEYNAFSTKNKFDHLDLDQIPFAVPITIFPGSPTGVKTLDNWPTEIRRKIAFQFELLETALDVARYGHAAVFCPSFLIKLQNQALTQKHKLYQIKHSPKVKRAVYVAKRKSYSKNQNVLELFKALRKVLKAN